MTSGIYAIRCIPTDKVYVGSSEDIERRYYQHKYLLDKGKHHSLKLQNAWNKYGSNQFEILIVEQDCLDLIESEQKWINTYDAFKKGFNSRPLADRPGGTEEPTKGKSVKIRLDDNEYEKAEKWSALYKNNLSELFRMMLKSLPDEVPEIPKPPVKLP